jgi:hypothetical protein
MQVKCITLYPSTLTIIIVQPLPKAEWPFQGAWVVLLLRWSVYSSAVAAEQAQ